MLPNWLEIVTRNAITISYQPTKQLTCLHCILVGRFDRFPREGEGTDLTFKSFSSMHPEKKK